MRSALVVAEAIVWRLGRCSSLLLSNTLRLLFGLLWGLVYPGYVYEHRSTSRVGFH